MTSVQLLSNNGQFDLRYKAKFDELSNLLPKNCKIEHIGSTSVKEALTKGVIDILIIVPHKNDIKKISNLLAENGYYPERENYNKERKFFSSSKSESKAGDFHIHLAVNKSPVSRRLILFRDILRKDLNILKQYNELRKCISSSTKDRRTYTLRKSNFIESTINKAINPK